MTVAHASVVPPAHADPAVEPTFNKDLAPIVYKNCSGCHHPGEVAPFPLLSYGDLKKRTKQIGRVTEGRLMPPWKPEPGYGEFLDERRLTDSEIALFKAWLAAGAPQGEPADLPPAPSYPDGWALGEPDLVLTATEAFTVPPEGPDLYRCFVLPVDVPEDRWVRAAEFRPGNRRVVHHALFFLDTSGAARKLDDADPGPGYAKSGGPGFIPTGGLGGWAPGAMPRPLPDGYGRALKKGSDFVLQVHYHPSGKPETDRSTVGIYFAKEKPAKKVITIPFSSRKIDIPPGEKAYHVENTYTLPVDAECVGIIPHAHLICRDIRGQATLPDGTVVPVIRIGDWDFNWQDQYVYRTPLRLPKGTRLEMAFTYDNSADNPRNPSTPPKRVTWGEQTTDEMAILFFQIAIDARLDLSGVGRALRERFGRRAGGKEGDPPTAR